MELGPVRRRSLILLVTAFLVALAAAGFILLHTFNLDEFRARVAAEIRAATGRDVVVRGRIHVMLSLAPAITMDDLEIGNFPSGSRKQMLVVDRFETRLRLLPLLFARRLEITSVVMTGVDLFLEIDSSGRSNSAFPAATSVSSQHIDEFRIEHATVNYRDQRSGWQETLDLPLLSAKAEPIPPLRYRFDATLRRGHGVIDAKGVVDTAGLAPKIVGKITAPELRFADLYGSLRPALGETSLEHVSANLSGGGETLELAELSSRLAGGDVNGRGSIDWSGPVPQLSVDLNVRDLDLAALSKELQVRSFIEGRVTADAKLTLRGASSEAMLGTLEGSVTAAMGEGRIRGSFVDSIYPGFLPSVAPWTSEQKNTPVNCAIARFDVRSGRAVARTLLVDTPQVTIVGKGTVDFGKWRIDALLNPYPKNVNLGRLALPIQIHGPLTSPEARADKLGIFQSLGDEVLRTALLPLPTMTRLLDLGVGAENACFQAMGRADGQTQAMLGERQKAAPRGIEGYAKSAGRRMKRLLRLGH